MKLVHKGLLIHGHNHPYVDKLASSPHNRDDQLCACVIVIGRSLLAILAKQAHIDSEVAVIAGRTAWKQPN